MLNSLDFDYIANLVKEESGITLSKGKEYLVQSRVEPVARSLGFEDISRFIADLQKTKDLKKRRQIVESLTTHETSFFRDLEPFEALRNKILPEIIARNRAFRQLTIWCGAASSGQEPYTICMLIRENFPELTNWNIKFIATDLSASILNKAKSGRYNQIEVNRGLPVRYLAKYFDKDCQEWVLKPEIRQMVQFMELNLLSPYSIIPQSDLVMLRNVLIYFDVETKCQILNKVHKILKPDGYLFLGTAETTLNLSDCFERNTFEKTSCYRKKGA